MADDTNQNVDRREAWDALVAMRTERDALRKALHAICAALGFPPTKPVEHVVDRVGEVVLENLKAQQQRNDYMERWAKLCDLLSVSRAAKPETALGDVAELQRELAARDEKLAKVLDCLPGIQRQLAVSEGHLQAVDEAVVRLCARFAEAGTLLNRAHGATTDGRLMDDIQDFLERHENLTTIDMVLFCPNCQTQHVDAPEPDGDWQNPPHRSHLCHGCGCIFRLADVPTNGVAKTQTRGKGDSWP